MDIKLNVTLIGCSGNVDCRKLEAEFRHWINEAPLEIWKEAGLDYHPNTTKTRFVGVEDYSEKEED